MRPRRRTGEEGFALVATLMLAAVLLALIAAYFLVTRVELSATRSSLDSIRGFYAAEAGVNLRAEEIRQLFLDYRRPEGVSPVDGGGQTPCQGGNDGTGDLRCGFEELSGRDVATWVAEDPGNPTSVVIPPGEPFEGLHAQSYVYRIRSLARGGDGRPEAIVEMEFSSLLVPMFQFAAFYDKDLEILPGPPMNLGGPVHTNGDLYLDAGDRLEIEGQVTTASDLYRGRKDADTCDGSPVSVIDPATLRELPSCSGGTTALSQSDLDAWNGMIRTDVDPLTVPPPEALDPVPGATYWDNADVRIVLNLFATPPRVEVRDAGGSYDAAASATLAGCGVASHTTALYNHREGTDIDMLDVDVEGLLDCLHATGLLGAGVDIDETSHGGLVWYLTVDGPGSGSPNNYGVRAFNGAELASTAVTAPEIRGLTVATDQAAYIRGHYNAVDKKPAAVLADSLNILSVDWDDSNSHTGIGTRRAGNTTIQAAFLAGTDTTGGTEGAAGQHLGDFNGGLENYPRFHENWSGRTLTYRGSFVSLDRPRHVDGPWGAQSYNPPDRDWAYDTDFNDASNLPPLTPRSVYLRQNLFLRDFER